MLLAPTQPVLRADTPTPKPPSPTTRQQDIGTREEHFPASFFLVPWLRSRRWEPLVGLGYSLPAVLVSVRRRSVGLVADSLSDWWEDFGALARWLWG